VLIVDAHRPLPGAVAGPQFKAVARRDTHVLDHHGGVHLQQLPAGGGSGAGAEGARAEFFDRTEEGLGASEITRAWWPAAAVRPPLRAGGR